MEIGVKYRLDGSVNGVAMVVEGTGTADTETGTLELSLDASPSPHPMHWDPALMVVGCMDGLIQARRRVRTATLRATGRTGSTGCSVPTTCL